MFAAIVIFLLGGIGGVTLATNEPAVAEFGDKYLSAEHSTTESTTAKAE